MNSNKSERTESGKNHYSSQNNSSRNSQSKDFYREISYKSRIENNDRSRSYYNKDKNNFSCKKHSLRDGSYSNDPNSRNQSSSPKEKNLFKLTETSSSVPVSKQAIINEETVKLMQNFVEKYEELKSKEEHFTNIEKENVSLLKKIEEISKEKTENERNLEERIKVYISEIDNLKNNITELKKEFCEKEELLRVSLNESVNRNKEIIEELVNANERNIYLEKFSFSLTETIKKMQEEFIAFLFRKGLLDKVNPIDFTTINTSN
jgi:hypothetical protein